MKPPCPDFSQQDRGARAHLVDFASGAAFVVFAAGFTSGSASNSKLRAPSEPSKIVPISRLRKRKRTSVFATSHRQVRCGELQNLDIQRLFWPLNVGQQNSVLNV